jgi:hypothetical protein
MPANFCLRPLRAASPLLGLLVASSLTVSVLAQVQKPIFPTNPTYVNKYGPNSLATGDFNGDGQPDVAFVEGGGAAGILVVLLNQGTINTFTSTTTTLSCAPTNSSSLVAADLNNDKKLDLAFTCSNGYVVVMLGNGDGSFQAPTFASVPSGGVLAAPADLNGDGYLDLVATSSNLLGSSPSVYVLLNKGSSAAGTFALNKIYPAPAGLYLNTAEIGDFNGDGKLDVLAGQTQLAIFYGNGDGTLQTPQTLSPTTITLGSPGFVTADFNHDGLTDIAFLTSTTNTSIFPQVVTSSSLQVLLGSSSGQFTTGPSLSLDTTANYTSLTLAGSSGNGYNLALSGSDILIALGDGNGGFSLGSTYDVSGSRALVGEAVGSTRTNLIADLGDIFVFLADNGDGTYQAIPDTQLGGTLLTPVDLNGDGLTDVLTTDLDGNLVAALGRGNGRFTVASRTPGFQSGYLPILAGDFNGDGKVDAVQLTQPGNNTLIVFSAGSGGGSFLPSVAGLSLPGNLAASTAVGDFNGDHILDLLVSFGGARTEAPPTVFLLAGNGDGTFAGPIAVQQQSSATANIPPILAVDLNGDGKLDFIWDSTVFLNTGGGTFNRQPIGIPLDSSTIPLAIGDLNGDGKLDLVTGGTYVYAGNGDGSFQTSPFFTATFPPLTYAGSALVGDVNADGNPDLLLSTTGQTLVFLGDGKGNFTPDSNTYSLGSGSLARLNNQAPALPNDGALDYLQASGGGVASFLNQLNPAPTIPALLPSKTLLSVSAGSAAPGQQLTYTATVIGTSPTGTIFFAAGSVGLGTTPLINGVATLSAAVATIGSYAVTATYSGDNTNAASNSNAVTVTVAALPSKTVLTVSAISAGPNQQLSLTATIIGLDPTGIARFSQGAVILGNAALKSGVATLPYTFTFIGSYPVVATYTGDIANLPSTSNTITVVVATPDYSITAAPAAATITAGQSASTTLTVAPIGGYSGTVSFGCGTLPFGATCTFVPASLTPGTGVLASTVLTITTTASTHAMLERLEGIQGIAWASILGLAFFPKRLPKMRCSLLKSGALSLLLLAGLISLAACSSSPQSSTTGATTPGTPAGIQTINVTASGGSGSPSHAIAFQLTVQ